VAKAAVKLFRDPSSADRALKELKARGVKDQEVSVIMGERAKPKLALAQPAKVNLPQSGTALATGQIAQALAKVGSDQAIATLSSLLGVPEEAATYYDFGVSLGGVLVSVQADAARLLQADKVLRSADIPVAAAKGQMQSTSPGFELAGRMAETDPLDAKMTGDFRKY